MSSIRILEVFIVGAVRNRTGLVGENLAPRQPPAVLSEQTKRARLRRRDRIFWVSLFRIWANWRSTLLIVQADTLVHWHRAGSKLFWRWKSRTDRRRKRTCPPPAAIAPE